MAVEGQAEDKAVVASGRTAGRVVDFLDCKMVDKCCVQEDSEVEILN